MIVTYCDYHLGDHLIHLNFLRQLAQRNPEKHFIHAAGGQYLSQLREIVDDMQNISLIDLIKRPVNAINAWKNRLGNIHNHVLRNDWVAFYMYVFDGLARDMGFENPLKRRADFLFNYPRLRKKKFDNVDFLVINSMPHSGQLHGINDEDFNRLVTLLLARGHSVITTSPILGVPCTEPLTVAEIGALSLACKYIVGVATGPIWTTFNIWNTYSVKLRLLLLNRERVLIAPNTKHAETMLEAINILREKELL